MGPTPEEGIEMLESVQKFGLKVCLKQWHLHMGTLLTKVSYLCLLRNKPFGSLIWYLCLLRNKLSSSQVSYLCLLKNKFSNWKAFKRTFQWHIYTSSKASKSRGHWSRIKVGCSCVHILWLPQWRRHWDATEVTRARMLKKHSHFTVTWIWYFNGIYAGKVSSHKSFTDITCPQLIMVLQTRLTEEVIVFSRGIININIRGNCVLGGGNSGECHFKPWLHFSWYPLLSSYIFRVLLTVSLEQRETPCRAIQSQSRGSHWRHRQLHNHQRQRQTQLNMETRHTGKLLLKTQKHSLAWYP